MTLLDENIPDDQQEEMERRGTPARKVGRDWGRKGMSDEDILAALRPTKSATLITRDPDFYRREHCHACCCIALFVMEQSGVAEYAIKFLRHPGFRTHAKRMGKVVRVQASGIAYWERNSDCETAVSWS